MVLCMKQIFAAGLGLLMILPIMGSATALEREFDGICRITSGTNGGQKYVTLKCHKVGEPGNYRVRSTFWERKNKRAYNNLIRSSGRSMKCRLVREGGDRTTRTAIKRTYDLRDCRR